MLQKQGGEILSLRKSSDFASQNKEEVFMNWKKVVSVLLVSAMTLSMAACGDTADTSDNVATGTET